jgi:hypothetical protein
LLTATSVCERAAAHQSIGWHRREPRSPSQQATQTPRAPRRSHESPYLEHGSPTSSHPRSHALQRATTSVPCCPGSTVSTIAASHVPSPDDAAAPGSASVSRAGARSSKSPHAAASKQIAATDMHNTAPLMRMPPAADCTR